VSQYLENTERLARPEGVVIYNSLSPAFAGRAERDRRLAAVKRHRVLMLCSLKAYKGVQEFLILARMLPAIAFELVLNADPEETKSWLAKQQVPENCSVYPTQTDTHLFYRRASIVINLSHPDKWVETFGMTVLEAMAYGLPVIVPPVGGVTELVTDGVNGFHRDYRDLAAIAEDIARLVRDEDLYRSCSEQALIKARCFLADVFEKSIRSIINHE
jgi:L-malate glycosyltransferase